MLNNRVLGINAKCIYDGVIVPTALYGADRGMWYEMREEK